MKAILTSPYSFIFHSKENHQCLIITSWGWTERKQLEKSLRNRKKASLKGDWIKFLEKDFEFMEIYFNEQENPKKTQETYSKKLKI